MGLLDTIKNTLANNTKSSTPEEYCPNCWGRQEYSGEFYNAVKAEGIDTNNIDTKKGWIAAYAEKYLTGIELKQQDAQLICGSCQMTYEKMS